MLLHRFGVLAAPVYCTKIASRLVRTYTDRHGLKYLVQEMLEIDISKQQQMSDWGAATLTQAQVEYAATDVLYLHRLRAALDARLVREGRRRWRRPVSTFCRIARRSTSRDGTGRTSSRIPEEGAMNPGGEADRDQLIAAGRRVIAIEAEALVALSGTVGESFAEAVRADAARRGGG